MFEGADIVVWFFVAGLGTIQQLIARTCDHEHPDKFLFLLGIMCTIPTYYLVVLFISFRDKIEES
jgi:hypothetical protein